MSRPNAQQFMKGNSKVKITILFYKLTIGITPLLPLFARQHHALHTIRLNAFSLLVPLATSLVVCFTKLYAAPHRTTNATSSFSPLHSFMACRRVRSLTHFFVHSLFLALTPPRARSLILSLASKSDLEWTIHRAKETPSPQDYGVPAVLQPNPQKVRSYSSISLPQPPILRALSTTLSEAAYETMRPAPSLRIPIPSCLTDTHAHAHAHTHTPTHTHSSPRR